MTPRQRLVLGCIAERARASGDSPSYRELQRAAGLRSLSSAHRIVQELVALGVLRVIPGRKRSMEILSLSLPRDAFLSAADALARHWRGGGSGGPVEERFLAAHAAWRSSAGSAEEAARQTDIEDRTRRRVA